MAYIDHFFRTEKVWSECNDKGFTWHQWCDTEVEHHCCSNCHGEVSAKSRFCSHCGEKLTGIKERYKSTPCEVCEADFTQLEHERKTLCPRCRELISGKYGSEIAKAFYSLGKTEKAKRKSKTSGVSK